LDDEASRVFFTIEAIYVQVLMPNDDILASGGGVTDFPANEVRGDRACGHGLTNDDGRTTSLADPFPEGP
jgi:hypothetical protein